MTQATARSDLGLNVHQQSSRRDQASASGPRFAIPHTILLSPNLPPSRPIPVSVLPFFLPSHAHASQTQPRARVYTRSIRLAQRAAGGCPFGGSSRSGCGCGFNFSLAVCEHSATVWRRGKANFPYEQMIRMTRARRRSSVCLFRSAHLL